MNVLLLLLLYSIKAILCTYIETQNPDVTMEAEVVAVYCGMSVIHSLKILRYVQIVAILA